MCGIAGELERRRADRAERRRRVRRAVEALSHRGPDDMVTGDIDEFGAWGMCRLAIRDPSPAGRQPFRARGVELIFNGEIYNTDELRGRLEPLGHTFRTTCDTEMLLAAYVEYGVDAFGLLDGMFAVAVVDRRANELVLARDEFGVKPLFVSATPGRLVFGSEPKALRELGALDGGIDVDHLERFLRYQLVPEPGSPWNGVRRVTRGTFEVYSLHGVELTRSGSFHQVRDGAPSPEADPEVWVDALEAAVRCSVRRQTVSDRPLGVFLSGGVDSTLVSAYAAEVSPRLRAFGLSIPGWDKDERRHMEEASRHLDVDLSVCTMTEHDFDRLVDRLLRTYDEPFADYSALPTMLVSEAAATDLRVVLSGDGGDELFGGYLRYRYAPLAERLGRLPPVVLRSLSAAMRVTRVGPAWLVDQIRDEARAGAHGFGAVRALRTQSQAAAILGRPRGAPSGLVCRPANRAWRSSDARAAAMAIDIEQYLPADILTKVDRATMSVSLEARVPLLGEPVASVASKMPSSIKIRDGVGKWPLKGLLTRRGFSDAFVHRRKVGFSLPISDWLRNAIARRPEYEDLIRDPLPPIDRVVSGACLDDLLRGADNGYAVWTILVLSGWLTRNA
jgi:asparagine synthase (glutamine-hydrolysing)